MVIEYIQQRFEFKRGDYNALTVRRKSVQTVGLFGAGAGTQAQAPFITIKQALPALLEEIRNACGPCSKGDVLTALHKVAEAQELAEMREGRGKRYTGGL